MNKNLLALGCTIFLATQLYSEVFLGTSIQYGVGESSDKSYAAKVYVQHSSLPILSFYGGVKNYSWAQEKGVVYNNLTIGSGQTVDFQGAFVGLGLNLWAKSIFFIDSSISYTILSDVIFEESVSGSDVTFPSSAYDVELGCGVNYGRFSFRPFYGVSKFNSDYTVLGKTLRAKTQHSVNFELIYWW